VVQDPNTSQSFNRYSYVHNNPLSFTDPTGYFSLRTLAAVVVGIALNFFLPGLGFNIFWTAFTIGFTTTFIITGNFRSALRAGLVAGALAYAGNGFSNKGAADAANSGSKAAAGGNTDVTQGTSLSGSAPEVTSASSGAGIASGVNAFDIAAQVVSSLDPEAGAVLSFLRGGIIGGDGKFVGVGGVVQNLASHYGKLKATEELERFARKNGLSLAELNLALVVMSFGGNKLVGTRFEADYFRGVAGDQGVEGMFSRDTGTGLINNISISMSVGLIFDVVDIALGFQGLITASGYEAIRRGDKTKTIGGFSLGSMDANNLVARGYFPNGVAKSLVFGNIGHSNVKVEIGAFDLINGAFFGKILNPFATFLTQPKNTFGRGCFTHEFSGCY